MRRDGVALLQPLGLSAGSFSPDFVLAGPWALALAYVLVLLAVLVTARLRRPSLRPSLGWACLVLLLAVADYLMTLAFRESPGLTVS